MFRFSLASLLLLVAFAAVGCAALINAGDLWRQAAVTAAIGLLLAATLAAMIGREDRRPLATGFAVFGWAYLLLTFVSALEMRADLLTDKSVAWLYEIAHREDQKTDVYIDQISAFTTNGEIVFRGSGGMVRLWDATTGRPFGGNAASYENFADIGHSLWAVVVACLGAALARYLSPVQPRRPERD